ncbi:MAG: ankyrin repeat domain-containing protein [Bacteriovoracaceae bacterium]|nr:ankyrin repeat domain-containing protein [Bacteriovoracaceae bacterium]
MSTFIKRGLSLSLSVLSTGTLAQATSQKVVYGVDNRVEVYEAPASFQKVAASTAAMIPIGKLTLKVSETDSNVRTYTAKQDSLKENGICEDDRYANQPTPAMCSGFLVGPDLIVTAGHCARGYRTCEDNTWVFGFDVDQATASSGVNIPAENVYRCKKIVNQILNGMSGNDHALIQLDRVVSDRAPLKFRTEGKIADNTPIVVMGHPMGLPTKIADGANVRTNVHPHYFVANLDTFGGNSGSAVFNTDDLVVEGILVRGETDYVYNPSKMCQEVNVCKDDNCRGEDVTRITDIIELAQGEKVLNAAAAGDLATVKSYLDAKGWIEMRNNNGETILMKAAQAQLTEVAEMLIAQTAEVNAKDLVGETSLMKAVRKSNTAMVELLLASGADANLTNAKGINALGMTKWFNLKQRKIRKLLKAAMAPKKG